MDEVVVTREEYRAFHAMDRALYSVLVVELWRNPYEAIQVVALWICFERLGFKNFIQKVLSLPRIVINNLADEALMCYECIRDPQFLYSAKVTKIPLTHTVLKKNIPLSYFHHNRDIVIDGIWDVVSEVCVTSLTDVFGQAIKRHSAQKKMKKPNKLSLSVDESLFDIFADLRITSEFPEGTFMGKKVSPVLEQSLIHNFARMDFAGELPQSSSNNSFDNMAPSAFRWSLRQIFDEMGFKGQTSGDCAGNTVPPKPAQFSSHSFADLGLGCEITNGPVRDSLASPVLGQSSGHSYPGFGARVSNGRSGNEWPPENRTLFVTFSKGYPVAESEVREFFTQLFGNCIEAFYMQPVLPHEQALYARVVFFEPEYIDLILNGVEKAKYTINGKHLWMRKFVSNRSGRQA